MKRSRITSLLGLISLGLIACSYFLSINSDINFVILIMGGMFSVVLIIPTILCAYFEVHSPPKGGILRDEPIGRWLSIYYGMFFSIISIFMGWLLFSSPLSTTISLIPGIIIQILWISTGVLGIVAVIVYRDDKKNDQLYLLSFEPISSNLKKNFL